MAKKKSFSNNYTSIVTKTTKSFSSNSKNMTTSQKQELKSFLGEITSFVKAISKEAKVDIKKAVSDTSMLMGNSYPLHHHEQNAAYYDTLDEIHNGGFEN